jgi:hypothetical protein
MDRLPESETDFKSFEQQCYDMGMAFARMLMTTVLSDLDIKLLEKRDKTVYRAKDLRPLTIKTLMGEVTVKRRLYKYFSEDGHAEYVYLLDRAIGLDTIGKFSIGLIRRMAELITESSYRAAADAISFLSGQSISHGGFWNAVQAAGARICEEDNRRAREAAQGKHKGTKRVSVLHEEYDGVYINMRGKDRPKSGRKLEMKLALAHEGVKVKGKDKKGKILYALVNPVYTAGFEDADKFFLKKEGQLGAIYDLDEIDTRLLNGDGGGWIAGFGERSGCECHFQLDRFHIKRAFVRGGIPEEEMKAITNLIDEAKVKEALVRLKSIRDEESDEKKKEKIGEAYKYLSNHKESLVPILKRGLSLPPPAFDADAYGTGGAMESGVCGVIALRMKKRRASFTKDGATHLARLLCLKRSGSLDEFICGLSGMKLPVASEEVITIVLSAAKAPKKDGKGYDFPRKGGMPFEGAATTNGRMAIKGLVSLRGLTDLGSARVGGQ